MTPSATARIPQSACWLTAPFTQGGLCPVLVRLAPIHQLVSRLADLMDQYEVRRPEIVERWLKGLNATGKGKPAPGRLLSRTHLPVSRQMVPGRMEHRGTAPKKQKRNLCVNFAISSFAS